MDDSENCSRQKDVDELPNREEFKSQKFLKKSGAANIFGNEETANSLNDPRCRSLNNRNYLRATSNSAVSFSFTILLLLNPACFNQDFISAVL